MILEEKVMDMVVVGEDTSKKAKISQDKLAKLQYLLTKGLYKDPITAVIAEWTNNGIDSVVQAGKNPVENPVVVSIGITPESKGQTIFRVHDTGIGLDDRDFENICMNYLESTKEEDNDTIGHFGIGMKSFLSLERSATFICRKDGIERKYLVYEGPEFVNFDLLYTKETTEENGVIAELVIKDWSEKLLFNNKAKAKLAYYDTVVLMIDNVAITNTIYRNELFQWSTMSPNSRIHICLKDVYYPIDWEALGIKEINLPIAIRLGLGDGLRPTPSRESYITNDVAKELITRKIQEIADWFVGKYNTEVLSFNTFMKAYEYLDTTTYRVKLDIHNTEFVINPLVPYSKLTVAFVKVDGVRLERPLYYRYLTSHFLTGFNTVAYLNKSRVLKTKKGIPSKTFHIFDRKEKVVIVGTDFRGNIKSYLREKYCAGALFLRRNEFDRKLGGERLSVPTKADSYKQILNLKIKPKSEWRGLIEEFNFVQSSIIDTFNDETKVADDPKFLDWVKTRKDEQKKLRETGTTYLGLGKKTGDVTLAYGYLRYGKVYFKKEVFPVSGLKDNKFLTVLVTSDDDENLAKEISLAVSKNVKFALVGKLEIKKIPKHFQFINFQTFMSRNSKVFMRLASAIKFNELIEDYKGVKAYKNVVFAKSLKQLNSDVHLLEEYAKKNMSVSVGENFKNVIIDIADEKDLYDRSLWDVYTRVKEKVHKYDFINMLDVPPSTNEELSKRYEKLVNQILLFRKKYYDDLPEGASIVFEETKTETNEKLV